MEKLSTNLQIIIFTRSLPFHRIGGMEIIVWNLAKSFSKKGHSVEIITTKIPEKKDEFVEDGIKIVPIKNTSSGKYSLRWWHYSRQYLKKKKPLKNLVILSVSIAGVSLLNIKKFKNTPILCQAHGTSWGEAISKWKTKNVISVLKSIKNIMYLPIDIFFLPYFSKIIAIGPDVENNLKKFPYFLAPHKIIRINNGIDRSLFVPSKNNRKNFRKENNISEDTVLIVSVCRIHEQKGVDNIIESFHIYNKKNQNSLLIIIGEGPYKKEIIQRCDLLKISEKVIFFGNCNQDEIALVLQSADIFAFLTKRIEGLPLNVLEALSCDLICIVSNHLNLPSSSKIIKTDPINYNYIAELIEIYSQKQIKSTFPIECSLDYATMAYIHEFESIKKIE